MGWNDPITATTDLFSLAFQQMFRDAVAERVRAGGGSDPYPTPLTVTQYPFAASYIAALQAKALVPGGNWVRRSARYEGTASGYVIGLSTLQASIDAGLHIDPIAPGTPRVFRRRRRREIASSVATVDTQGNTIANGMKAWIGCVLYQRVAGAWAVIDSNNNDGDLLDSWLARPNYVPGGDCQVDDYIGWWLYDEMRNVINQYVWLRADITSRVLTTRIGSALGVEYEPGGLTAQGTASAAAQNFADAPNGPNDSRNSSVLATGASGTGAYNGKLQVLGYTEGNVPGSTLPSWGATLWRDSITITATAPAFAGRSRMFEYYNTRVNGYPNSSVGVYTSTAAPSVTAAHYSDDAQGENVGPNTTAGYVKKWLTIGPVTGNPGTQTFGHPTTPPALPGFLADDDWTAMKGFVLWNAASAGGGGGADAQTIFAIVKWDVVGGFKYVGPGGGFAPGVAGLEPLTLNTI